MTEKTEHRGWELESNYHQHYLDDPTFDLAEDDSEGTGKRLSIVFAIALFLVAALYALNLWLAPPVVKFSAPIVTVAVSFIPPGWTAHCIRLNSDTKTMEPDPRCRSPKGAH